MNKHTIIGNLTQDPTSGTTPDGVNYCRFTVAVNRIGKDRPPEYIRVTAWRSLGDSCRKYLRKGRKVAVIGSSVAYAWQGQDGSIKGQIQMDAETVEFLTPRSEEGEVPADAPQEPVDPQSGMTVVEPEEQPF